jgi:hypothetical protein
MNKNSFSEPFRNESLNKILLSLKLLNGEIQQFNTILMLHVLVSLLIPEFIIKLMTQGLSSVKSLIRRIYHDFRE